MKPTGTTDATNRSRRFGRKALNADRLNHALGSSSHLAPWQRWRTILQRKPRTIAVCCLIVGLGGLGVSGVRLYSDEMTKMQRTIMEKQQVQAVAESASADACRRKKAEEKADQLGKITYDQLYDFGECDK